LTHRYLASCFAYSWTCISFSRIVFCV
jgi:hypothetical protein